MTGRILLLTLLGVIFLQSEAVDLRRAVDIQNESGERLELYWLRPGSGEAVKYMDLENGAKIHFNSFINHTFMLREGTSRDACDSIDNDACVDNDSHVNFITVTEDHNQSKCLGIS